MSDKHPAMTAEEAAAYIDDLYKRREAWVRRRMPSRFQTGRGPEFGSAYRTGVIKWNARHPHLIEFWRAHAGPDTPPVDPSEE